MYCKNWKLEYKHDYLCLTNCEFVLDSGRTMELYGDAFIFLKTLLLGYMKDNPSGDIVKITKRGVAVEFTDKNNEGSFYFNLTFIYNVDWGKTKTPYNVDWEKPDEIQIDEFYSSWDYEKYNPEF